MIARPLALILVAALAGCAVWPHLSSALQQQGLRPAVANCMAQRMTDRLSVDQIRKLGRAAGPPGERVGDLTVAQLIERAQRVGDPKVVAVTVEAGAICSATN